MKKILLPLLLAVLTGCAGQPQTPPLAEYGLSFPESKENLPIRSIHVSAAPWLDGRDMVYRQEYKEPGRRFSYAQSRWQASPSDMMERYLGQALMAHEGRVAGQCRLHVELDRFEQDFLDSQRSRGTIAGRAILLSGNSHIARHGFIITFPAPSQTAQGGVAALNQGADHLALTLSMWLKEPEYLSLCAQP